MGIPDYLIFGAYLAGVLGVGFYYYRRNKNTDDYFVAARSLKAPHVGLSIAATDVGGGFSIGLGGLGFTMGLSGSWLMFTGLVGAWLTAIVLIPRVKKLDKAGRMMTYPDFLRHRYGKTVALFAAIISGVGYMGFTGAQMLAGARLASATILPETVMGMDADEIALLILAAITVLYTVFGGLRAVVYTDTIQWVILICGLSLVTIPATLHDIGGWAALRRSLPDSHFPLTNIGAVQLVNWFMTIVPIWFVGMTLYQRMYACKDEREAKRAWFIAGLFEYPVMAFTGVFLGMCARVVFPEADPESAMPMVIRHVLPIGVTGIVIAAYFSAIMSTADSCLMAASGNLVGDIMDRHLLPGLSRRHPLKVSMIATFTIGTLAVLLAFRFGTVLDAILYAYGFMVAGLFVPTVGGLFWRAGSATGATLGMVGGGGVALSMLVGILPRPKFLGFTGLDPAVWGIVFSACLYIAGSILIPDKRQELS